MKNKGKGASATGSGVKLQWKLLLYMLLFTGVILAILWLSLVVFLDRIYQEIKIHEIENTAASLCEIVNTGDEITTAAQMAQTGQFCLFICNLDTGEVLLSEEALDGCSIHPILTTTRTDGVQTVRYKNLQLLCAAARSTGGSIFYRVTGQRSAEFKDQYPSLQKEVTLTPGAALEDETNATSIIYISLTQNRAGEEFAVILNAMISPVRATVETLYTLLKIISLLLLFLSVALSWLVARKISKPIANLTESAKILAHGDYSVDFQGKGYREVAQLGDTLHYAATELSKVDALRRDLIANVSHDLRTPLTLISGYAEVMRDIPGENTKENLQIIIDESDRLKQLVSDILDLSRLQSARDKGTGENSELTLHEFSLTDSIESELCRYNKLRDREGYSIHFLYDSLVTVRADRSRIMQVVYNLVNNAVNYCGEDKSVTVRQTVQDGFVKISVSDTGKGIAPEELPRIFERYYRDTTTHRRAPIGTGLGLAIVREIISAHGGKYGVESALGKGSTFWFSLPYLSVHPLAEKDDFGS